MNEPRFLEHLKKAISASIDAWRKSASSGIRGGPDEEKGVLAEVNRRKERARESGVITSAFKLYDEKLPYYDAWAKNCPELLHPDIKVIEITEAVSRNEGTKRIAAVIRGSTYVFTFRRSTSFLPDGEKRNWGYLDLDFQGQHVMMIDCDSHDDRYAGTTWSATGVSAFIEGSWVAELNTVVAEIKQFDEERRRRAEGQAKKSELEDLKKNFGL